MPPQTCLVRFSLIGLAATVIVAVITAFALTRVLEQDVLDREAQALADELLHFTPRLRPADFAAPLTPERYAAIDADYRRELCHPGILRFRIWTGEGAMLYSDMGSDPDAPLPPDFAHALAGKPSAVLRPDALFYSIPVRFGDAAPVGVYELRVDPAPVKARLSALRNSVWSGIGLGFAVVYLALFGTAFGASRVLIRRESEARERLSELNALFEVSATSRAAQNAAEMLPVILDKTVEVMRADVGAILLLDESGETFTFRAARGESEALLGLRHERCQDPLWRVVDSGQPLVIADLDVERDSLGCETSRRLFDELTSCACVPLQAPVGVIGALFLGCHERRLATGSEMRLITSIADMAANAIQRARLFDELHAAYLETVVALANTVDAKDTYTGGHGERLAEWAVAVGREMGVSKKELEDLRFGALLHDVGKIGVPDSILGKPGPLTSDEWAAMRRHPEIGRKILEPVHGLQGVCDIVCHHHERYDGAGYPAGLAGEAIPLGARILTVVDTYGAITDQRVYKPARSHAEAVAELRRGAGTQFDPLIVEAFLRVFQRDGTLAGAPDSFGVEPVLEPSVDAKRKVV